MNADCLDSAKYKLDKDNFFFLNLGYYQLLLQIWFCSKQKQDLRREKERQALQKESRAG